MQSSVYVSGAFESALLSSVCVRVGLFGCHYVCIYGCLSEVCACVCVNRIELILMQFAALGCLLPLST